MVISLTPETNQFGAWFDKFLLRCFQENTDSKVFFELFIEKNVEDSILPDMCSKIFV